MRKVLLALCVAGLLQSAANAAIVGSWAETTSTIGGVLSNTYTFSLTPTAGETIAGFDLSVYDTAAGPATSLIDNGDGTFSPAYPDAGTWTNNGGAFNSAANKPKFSCFNITAPTAMVANGVDSSDIYLAGSTSGSGWSSVFALLHIVKPAAGDTYTINPVTKNLNGVSYSDSNENLLPLIHYGAIATLVDGSKVPITFAPAPEPSTLALLGCSLFGLLAYAWRKRK
jgi:hypothetical protein